MTSSSATTTAAAVDMKDINDLNLDSFLSPYVRRVVNRFVSTIPVIDDVVDDLCLNWRRVVDLMPTVAEDIDFESDNVVVVDNEEELIRRIAGDSFCQLIVSVDAVYRRLIAENYDHFCRVLADRLCWTQHLSRTLMESVALLSGHNDNDGDDDGEDKNNSSSGVQTILAVQLITSCCEQSLGNLVLASGQQSFVPPLLKDLLKLDILKTIVGSDTVRLFQLIMGSPITVNIRNILWHGFVRPDGDIDGRFGYILLAICATIGRDLDDKYRNCCSPQRPLHDVTGQLQRWKRSLFPILTADDISVIWSKVFIKSPFILTEMLPLWKYSLTLYKDGRYGHSLAVMFPQLEACLRYIYCCCNRIPSKLMTAVAKQYYLTFAEILSPTLDDDYSSTDGNGANVNKIYTIFGHNFIEMLVDIIVIPDGPRIRDKLSHGQCDLYLVQQFVANHVICAAICALVLADSRLFNNRLQHQDYDIIDKLLSIAANYRCIYHPLSQLRQKMCDFAENLIKFRELVTDCTENHIENILVITVPEIDILYDGLLTNIMITNETNSDNNDKKFVPNIICDKLNEFNLNIFNNNKNNESMTIAMRQIVDNCCQSVANMTRFLVNRRKQFLAMSLRSRQRTNYQLMLTSGQLFYQTFTIVLATLYLIFISDSVNNYCRYIQISSKTLKYLLSLSENINSNSGSTVNKWDKCLQLSQTIGKVLNDL